MPRPVDDAAADASPAGGKPAAQTIQPRGAGASSRPVDITDLPTRP
jgi:hypothetical protein